MATQREFVRALKDLNPPQGRQREFLREHLRAPGRAVNARTLAASVGYQDHRGINLHYGLLARKIGEKLGKREARLSLLVDFVRPKSVSNTEWLPVMRPEFADALQESGWV
jgi:hypothetical protein